ncbi:MAG TPA: hypothetical protein DCL61_19020 [Cyanobacteria bacterium UBA12227]|nr:hypothetical protein [Cyanobacteria bacterium UBA12227]HAX87500.1 hypothetical protein [Cyanobacteria bacterium UBA11370]
MLILGNVSSKDSILLSNLNIYKVLKFRFDNLFVPFAHKLILANLRGVVNISDETLPKKYGIAIFFKGCIKLNRDH